METDISFPLTAYNSSSYREAQMIYTQFYLFFSNLSSIGPRELLLPLRKKNYDDRKRLHTHRAPLTALSHTAHRTKINWNNFGHFSRVLALADCILLFDRSTHEESSIMFSISLLSWFSASIFPLSLLLRLVFYFWLICMLYIDYMVKL